MGLTNKHEKEVAVSLAVILFARGVSRALFLFLFVLFPAEKNIFEQGKNKNRKNKKGKLFQPAAGAVRPKSNAIKEGYCAVALCVYGGIFWPGQMRWLLCAAAELRGIFFMVVCRSPL